MIQTDIVQMKDYNSKCFERASIVEEAKCAKRNLDFKMFTVGADFSSPGGLFQFCAA